MNERNLGHAKSKRGKMTENVKRKDFLEQM